MNLAGVFAPIPTPFDGADRIDTGKLRAALTKWVRTPLTGFVVLGTSGEAALLDDEESDRVIEAAREVVPSGRPFVAGTGRESTQGTIAASRRAAALGADAVMVRTPAFYKARMTTEVLVRHYTAVADASRVPVVLYNFSAMTGVALQPDAVARLSDHPNIVGVKESSGDGGVIAAFAAAGRDRCPVLTGSATTFHAALEAGAVGGVLALASVLPEACVRIFECAREGRHEEARALQERIAPVSSFATSQHGVAGLKAALNAVGYDVGAPRGPLPPARPDVVARIAGLLAAFQGAPA